MVPVPIARKSVKTAALFHAVGDLMRFCSVCARYHASLPCDRRLPATIIFCHSNAATAPTSYNLPPRSVLCMPLAQPKPS